MRRISLSISPILLTAMLFLLLFQQTSHAATPWSETIVREDGLALQPIIGRNLPYIVGKKETLVDLARRAGLGYLVLNRANKEVDPWLPEPGREILLPYAAILPGGAVSELTVNLAELRLYHIRREEDILRIRHYPVGIGSEGWETPEGSFVVTEKIRNPSWTIPPVIRSENPSLPASVPPGPENPLGDYWIGFSAPGYGIHGTNKPFGVGRRVSHGCLRLYPDDIRELFDQVVVGTEIRIVYQPVKVGRTVDALVVEIHPDILGKVQNSLQEVLLRAKALGWKEEWLDPEVLEMVIEEARGIPITVSRISEKTKTIEASLGSK